MSEHVKISRSEAMSKTFLSSVSAVQCEAKVLSIVGWHPLFPKFYGINGTHRLVMEDLGWYDDQGKYEVNGLMCAGKLWKV